MRYNYNIIISTSLESDESYGLRRRTKGKLPFSQGWKIEPLPSHESFRKLPVSDIKADIYQIKTTLEVAAEDEGIYEWDEDKYFGELSSATIPSLKKCSKTSLMEGESLSSTDNYFANSRLARSTNLFGSNNFYYPFKKMKQAEELKEYLDFVNEETFQSTRHAFVNNLKRLGVKRDHQNECIQKLQNIYKEELEHYTNKEIRLEESSNTIINLVKALQYFKSKSDALCRDKTILPGIRQKSDIFMDPWADLQYVNTVFGHGIIRGFCENTLCLKVQLTWGATAFLNLNAIDETSSLESSTSCEQTIESSKRPVLYTTKDYGAPRGIPLYLNPVSTEGHFALPPLLNKSPASLESIYQNQHRNDETSKYAVRNAIEKLEQQNADFDLESARRNDLYLQLPFSWGSRTDVPWDLQDKGLSRRDIDEWGAERNELRLSQGRMNLAELKVKEHIKYIRKLEMRVSELQQRNTSLTYQLMIKESDCDDDKGRILKKKRDETSSSGESSKKQKRVEPKKQRRL